MKKMLPWQPVVNKKLSGWNEREQKCLLHPLSFAFSLIQKTVNNVSSILGVVKSCASSHSFLVIN